MSEVETEEHMETKQHTPTPWRLMEFGTSGGLLVEKKIVVGDCQCKRCGDGLTVIATLPLTERQRQDGELIVEAVNSHHAITAQRNELREAVKVSIETIRAFHGDDGEGGSWDIYYEHSPEMKRLRAALD